MNQLNGMMRSVFQDLVEKRLWPVALVLVIALIAIPVVLSKPADSTPAPTPAAATTPATGSGGALSAFQPVVSSEGSKSSEIRKALKGFKTKDPFEVQGLKTGGAGEDGSVQVEGGDASATGGDSGSGGGGGGSATPESTSDSGDGSGTSATGGDTGSGGGGSATPESTSDSGDGSGTSAPPLRYFTYTVDVRFGKEGNLDKKNLDRFRTLPSSENPVVVFMGTTDDGDSAVFMVSAASSTTGEGDCQPSDTCTFVYMQPGQTQSFEAVDGNNEVVTYVLKLLRIKVEEVEAPATSSSRAARNARSERVKTFTSRIEALGF